MLEPCGSLRHPADAAVRGVQQRLVRLDRGDAAVGVLVVLRHDHRDRRRCQVLGCFEDVCGVLRAAHSHGDGADTASDGSTDIEPDAKSDAVADARANACAHTTDAITDGRADKFADAGADATRPGAV